MIFKSWFKFIILFIFACLIALSAVGGYFLISLGRINSDLTEYLGGYKSAEGLEFLSEVFGIKGDLMFAVEGNAQNDSELKEKINKISQKSGVKTLIWYEAVLELEDNIPPWFDSLPWAVEPIDTTSLKDFLLFEKGGKGVYLVLIMLEFAPSSPLAFEFLKETKNILAPREVEFAGMTATAYEAYDTAMKELPLYILFGGIAIVLLLLIFTKSIKKTLAILITLATALIINIGSSYILDNFSIITFASSQVIQIAFTVAFGLLFVAIATENGKRTLIKGALISSAMFVPLIFISMSLGADLALGLFKACLISVASISLLLPALLSVFYDSKIFKGKEKPPKCEESIGFNKNLTTKLSYNSSKSSFVISLCLVLILIISAVAVPKVDLTYFEFSAQKGSKTAVQEGADRLSSMVIMAVPLTPRHGKTHHGFIEKAEELSEVDLAIGAFTAIKVENILVYSAITSGIIDLGAVSDFFATVGRKHFTLYAVALKNSEGKSVIKDYEKLTAIANEHFSEVHAFGVASAVYDISENLPRDFYKIVLFSLIIAFLLTFLAFLKLNFKNPRKLLRNALFALKNATACTLTLIFSTFLTLTLTYLCGFSLNFLALYLLPTATGCFGVLFLFFAQKQKAEPIQNSEFRIQNCGLSVIKFKIHPYALCPMPYALIKSSLILLSFCLAVFFVTSNLIVKNISLSLGISSMISSLLCAVGFTRGYANPAPLGLLRININNI
ncbi:MAG: hypothetical protein FWD49_05870 [Firmicutes bacterium]|nr:hypothetical protein [Bacillota bacterium]